MTGKEMKHSVLFSFFALLSAFLNAAEVGEEWFFKFDSSLKPADAQRLSLEGKVPNGAVSFKLNHKLKYFDLKNIQKQYRPIRDAGIITGTIMTEKEETCLIGIGCDWWFTCYINGELTGTTEPSGNGAGEITPYHNRYMVNLKKGKNQVAIHTRAGSASWGFAFALLPDFKNWPEDQNARELLFDEVFPVSKKDRQKTGGPVVSHVTVNSAVITMAFDPPAAALLRYREKTADPTQTKEIVFRTGGLLDMRKYYRFELTGLKENTQYEYEVFCLNEDAAKKESAGAGVFTTFPLKSEHHSFAVFSDTQISGKGRIRFLQECRTHHLLDGAFYVSLGDMTSNFTDFFNAYFTTSLNELRYPEQKNTFVPVRGNHEFRGSENVAYMEVFGRPYYHFTYGDTIYIVLDTGEDKAPVLTPGHYTLRHDTEYYFKEQAAWFKALTETPEFRNAKHRIVLAHAIPFACMEPYMAKNIRDVVGAYFYGEDAPYRLDLWICGHMHTLMYSDPLEKTLCLLGGKERRMNLSGTDREIPFPVLVNDGSFTNQDRLSVTRVDVLPDCLELRVYRCTGTLLKALRLRPGKPIEILQQ